MPSDRERNDIRVQQRDEAAQRTTEAVVTGSPAHKLTERHVLQQVRNDLRQNVGGGPTRLGRLRDHVLTDHFQRLDRNPLL
jgi:hypothetical protein